MLRPSEKLWLILALAAVAAGCKPKIGEDCRISTDCSATGDRLCDITAPGGYCTVFNCEPGSCPEDESLCVQFGAKRTDAKVDDPDSSLAACTDAQTPSPYARSFCMATCKKNGDCRSGYVCEDLAGDNARGALLIDRDRGSRACVVAVTTINVTDPGEGGAFGDVCRAKLPTAAGGTTSGSGGTTSGSGGTTSDSGGGGAAGQAGQGG
jgi:uncharacterized membrane protein YgcG